LPSENTVNKDEIIQNFNLDVESSKKVNFLSNGLEGRLYEVNIRDFNGRAYILDTLEGREVACNPHIVGKELESRCLNSAISAVKVLKNTVNFEEAPPVVLNVLRAAPGYMMTEALQSAGEKFNQVWIRVKYFKSSYRDHVTRKLRIIYEDFESLHSNSNVTLIVPDTFATGASAEIAIKRTLEVFEKTNTTVNNIILYGFISEDSVRYLSKALKEYESKIIVLTLEDIMQVASNNYDMAIYGLDLGFYEKNKKIKKISSIIPSDVLDDCLPYYAPGSDQPGDFSSRQSKLFNGEGWEPGPIFSHLLNSLTFLKGLEEISKNEPWYNHNRIFNDKKSRLGKKCIKYLPHSLLYPKQTIRSIRSFL